MTRTKAKSKLQQPDLVCFSHLRWDFVYQRPQHLMSRFAGERRVFFIEEPKHAHGEIRLQVEEVTRNVWRVVPWINQDWDEPDPTEMRTLIARLFAEHGIERPVLWYFTPMALLYSAGIEHRLVVYDCMDDLASFKGAHRRMQELEETLLKQAGLVFTGGRSLYEAKRLRHPDVHLFPSGIDTEHFRQARALGQEPEDQREIPHPRLGYFGVIDERMDLGLLHSLAESCPGWQLVMIGPVAKLAKEDLPRRENIHYLGQKPYAELPAYLSGWDVALIPFARNQATRFISPTKTPEYLAGGIPVVSTPVRDVVLPYGEKGLVWIAAGMPEYARAIEAALSMNGDKGDWLQRVDEHLLGISWDETWKKMNDLIQVASQKASQDALHLASQKASSEALLTASQEPLEMGLQRPEKAYSAGPSLDGTPYAEETIAMPPVPDLSPGGKRSPGRGRGFDYLIVGAGFAGSVLAERLARGAGKRVLIIDRRPHIAGNAYDCFNDDGLLVHKYGPHIFHTNSKEVFAYLSQFTRWRPYEHRVRASVDGQLLPIPINLDTVNRLYGLNLSSMELEGFFASLAEPVAKVETSEDVVVGKIGRELYEKFFRNYTRKQWGLDPSELDASVTSRVPVRLNRDDRYFTDTFQSMPLFGYTRMFENLLDHPNIQIMLNADFQEVAGDIPYRQIIYTGPVDEYFNYCYGKLPYRSLQFRHETLDETFHQPVAVVNYPNEHAYTRVTEFKHLTGQTHPRTSLVYEYPCSDGDPYYPIPRAENAELYKRYKALADREPGVYFCGRLATYRYYNMDQVTAQALTLYARILGKTRAEAIDSYTPARFTIEMPCPLVTEQDTEG